MAPAHLRRVSDYARHDERLELTCASARCGHRGVVHSGQAHQWFMLHRWPDTFQAELGSSALARFRCTRCGARAGRVQPTSLPVTVTGFFPASTAEWKLLAKRLRD